MKKSVAIIIFIIFIFAIVVINFYGLKTRVYNPIFYVKEITCENEEAIIKEDESYSIIIKYEEDLIYQLYFKVLPKNATNRDVTFVYDKESRIASVDKFGRVLFDRAGVITVYIKSVDGSGISRKIKIIAY